MRRYVTFGVISAVLLLLFLLLRPQCARIGAPAAPDTEGRARLRPEETAGGPGMPVVKAPVAPVTLGAPRSDVEQAIVTATNEERRKAGLPPLEVEDFLAAAARKHSADMIERGFFDHVNPDGLTPADRVAVENRNSIGGTGENIYSSSGSSGDAATLAREIMTSWMNSPPHRENILRREFTHIGVGVVPADKELRATQVFARILARTNAPIPPSIARDQSMVVGVAPGPVPCHAVDVFSRESGLAVLGPVPLGDVKMSLPAGVYKLRFYCGSGASRMILSGPRFEVK